MGRTLLSSDSRSANGGSSVDSTESKIYQGRKVKSSSHWQIDWPMELLRGALDEMRSFEAIFTKMAKQLRVISSTVHVAIRGALEFELFTTLILVRLPRGESWTSVMAALWEKQMLATWKKLDTLIFEQRRCNKSPSKQGHQLTYRVTVFRPRPFSLWPVFAAVVGSLDRRWGWLDYFYLVVGAWNQRSFSTFENS